MKLTLDQVIDVPFLSNKMAKVEVPVVPVVRGTSFDSMDSVRMQQVDSVNSNSALDMSSCVK